MKIRLLPLLLSALLLLSLSSCLVIDQGEQPTVRPTEAESLTQPPTPVTDPITEAPPRPSQPLWTAGQDLQEAEAVLRAPTGGIVNISKQAYSYTELQEDLHLLSKVYPTLFSYRSIGKSVAGRDIYVAVLGNPNAARQVVVSAAIHAREYMTAMLTMKQLEFYLSHYYTGTYNGIPYATLFDEICFYIVPMTNPDGVMLSQEGISSLPAELQAVVRTIYSNESGGYASIDLYLAQWKANAHGVDLNRNYDALWEQYAGASRPQSSLYKGVSPASEPETQAMVNLINGLSNPICTLCIHSQGEVIYWNCGQSDPGRTHAFADTVADRNGYRVLTEQNNDASLSDWCELKKGMISITVETGNVACPLPLDQFEAIWLSNYDLLPLTAVYFRS